MCHRRPPWARTIERLMARPSPVPPDFVVKNGLNRCSVGLGRQPAAVVGDRDLDLALGRAAGDQQDLAAILRARRPSRRSRCARGSAPPAAAGSGRRRPSAGPVRRRCAAARCAGARRSRRACAGRRAGARSRPARASTSRFFTKLRSRRMTSPARSACALICSSAAMHVRRRRARPSAAGAGRPARRSRSRTAAG